MNLFKIIRWLIFSPLSALIAIILSIIVSSLFEIFQGNDWTFSKELFRSFTFGASFVVVAAYTVPNHKKRIALISCVMVIVFALVGSYINLSLSTQPLWNLIVSGTSATSGSIIALLYLLYLHHKH